MLEGRRRACEMRVRRALLPQYEDSVPEDRRVAADPLLEQLDRLDGGAGSEERGRHQGERLGGHDPRVREGPADEGDQEDGGDDGAGEDGQDGGSDGHGELQLGAVSRNDGSYY